MSFQRIAIAGLFILCPLFAFPQCWPRSQKLVPTKGPNTAERFGSSIDYENNIAVVAAPGSDTLRSSSGVVYVFEFKNGQWNKIASLSPSDSRQGQTFGQQVLIQDDQIFVADGRRKFDPNDTNPVYSQGAVYIYTKPAGGWHDMVETSILTPVHPYTFAFASSMDIYQDRLLVGASYTLNQIGVGAGAAFMFERQGNAWVQMATFKPSYTYNSTFGSNVALAENMAVVVADEENVAGNNTDLGATYVFEKNAGSEWVDAVPAARLTESSGFQSIAYLGQGLEIDEARKTIFVSQIRYDFTGYRTINVYERPPGGWADMTENYKYQSNASSQVFYQTLRFEEPYLYSGGSTFIEIFKIDPTGHWNLPGPVSTLTNSNFNKQQQFGVDIAVNSGRVLVSAPATITVNRDTLILPASPAIYDFQTPVAGWIAGTHAEDRSFTYMPTTATDYFFGADVNIDGDIAVVGSPYDNKDRTGAGVVYVYKLNNKIWNKIAKLSPSDGEPNDHFGMSISISGDHIVVSSSDKHLRNAAGSVIDFDLGAVYVFKKPPGGWTDMNETYKITRSEGKLDGSNNDRNDDHFGIKVALDYPTLVVSRFDNGARPNTGYVFVYNISSGAAVPEATLIPSSRDDVNNFGQALSIRDSVIAVGIGSTRTWFLERNIVYLYTRSGAQWKDASESAALVPSDNGATGYLPGIAFGASLDMTEDGTRIIVGAPGWFDGVIFQTTDYFKGAAYIYEKPAAGWKGVIREVARLTIPGQPAYGCLGMAVHIEDRYAAVGSPQNYISTNQSQNPGAGKVYFFQRPDGGWKYKLPDKVIQGDESGSLLSDYFGASVDGVFGYLMIGAIADDNQNSVDAGSVYVYTEYPFIDPAFSPVCENASPMQLTAFPGGGVWTSTGFKNPSDGIFYPSQAGPGLHKISYKVDDCDASNTLLIRVNAVPGELPIIVPDSLFFCGQSKVRVAATFVKGFNYTWYYSEQGQSFAGQISSQPSLDVDKSGFYKVVATNVCGAAADTVWVGDIFPNAGPDLSACYTGAVYYLAGNYPAGTWTGAGITPAGLFDPKQAGVGIHDLTYSVIPVPGCLYKDTKKMQVILPQPIGILVTGADTFCYTGQATLSATVIPNAQYTWYFGTNPGILNAVGHDPKIVADTPGYYKVTVTDAICTNDNTYQLVLPAFHPAISPTENPISFCQDDPLTIKAESITGADYKLFEYIGETPVMIQESTGSFSEVVRESGKFTVHIESHGCIFQSADMEAHRIPRDSLFVPNVFTPNGDAYNEHFDVYTQGIATYSLKVINRYGQEVWSGQKGTPPWNGASASAGVYFWIVSYESQCNGARDLKGWVQVVK